MAKKTPVKKSRRRLKRSIRRSLAAVLMITSIGVAAIPVPENYAADGIIPRADDTVEELPYSYPDLSNTTTVTLKNKISAKPKPPNPNEPDKNPGIYTAYTINALSDGTYQMDWQFEFYLDEKTQKGIISQYNSLYAQDNVTLNPNITCDYQTISEADFNKFFEDTGDVDQIYTYTVKDPKIANDLDKAFFTEYFANEYQAYVAGYDAAKKAYEQALEEWNANGGDPNTKPVEPNFTRDISQLSPDDRYKYYCDKTNGLAGCKLAVVIDSKQQGTGGTNVRVYIPKKIEGQNPTGLYDSQGFKYKTDASIIGIGDEAFKDTKNVLYLTVPKEIKYIGTKAFENSFLKEITLVNVEEICDRAFNKCRDLVKISIGSGVTRIGTESFYGSGVQELVFPTTIDEIGPGAFADCKSLSRIDFSNVTGSDVRIDQYAFFNTVALNEVNMMKKGAADVTVGISSIREGAFATDSGVIGNLTDFVFPSSVKSPAADAEADGLGDYVLAGRTNLQRVIMPADFGRDKTVKLPDNIFYNCYNLEYVRFPADGGGSCGYANYNPDKLFSTISNPKFYVWGPELDARRQKAMPRKTTWEAKTAVPGAAVPYRYDRNGKPFYEIGDMEKNLLMCIDSDGKLTSCVRMDTDIEITDPIDLDIPSKVGDTEVTGIVSDCFSDEGLNQNVKKLKLEDNSKITSIEPGVFKNWKKLQEVYIGNSIAQIGASAFEGCEKLIDVTFSSPLAGHEAFSIGENAFKTGSSELTFHGDIVKGYAPFEWAMAPDNLINQEGLRVCYTSLAPTYLTVMYDANTGLVTLLDYPKYDQIEARLIEAHKEEMDEGHYSSYTEMMVAKMYADYSGPNFDNMREAFKSLWIEAGTDEEAQEAAYKSEYYGPWISEDFCKDAGSWASSGGTGNITSDSSTDSAFIDFLFEPITAYAADASLKPYYTKYPYVIGNSGNADEQALLNAVCNIEIPEGVESIDVYGFISGVEGQTMNKNTANVNTYLMDPKKIDTKSWEMYTQRKPGASDPTNTDIVRGLFSGYYEDYESTDPDKKVYETANRGNDRVESITMHSVKYLPDYAFDSCERLSRVELGAALTDIGKAPFRGCYSMQAVGGNEKYECDNGIIYSKNTDGSYMIEECLSARGDKVGVPIVSASTDPKLNEVSTIKPGAFEDCDYLQEVNFGSRSTAGLTEIPEDCFRNCDRLDTVVLPMSVNDVGSGAFAGANELGTLTFYGKEVKISGSAFDGETKNRRTEVRTYKDSAVVRYVKEYGDAYLLYLPTSDDGWLGEQWKVTFLNFDYSVIEDLKDDEGNIIENPQYVEDGKVVERPQDAVLEGWTFEDWVGLNSTDIKKPIHEDTTFYAKGYSNDGTVGGKYAIDFYDSIDGKKIGPTQYIAPGGEAVAPAYPIHAGYTFDKWSDSFTNVKANKSILALYKATTVPGTSGGSTNTSNNTTNNPNSSNNSTSSSKNTSSDKNSSSSSSTSSTSSSNASTSTTSSDAAAGKHKVTVVNGAGSGDYTAGQTVWIIANPAADGQVFSKWSTSSQGVSLASVSSPTTSFTMPSSDVTVTAEYTAATAAPTTPTSTGGNGGGNGGGGTSTTGNGDTRVDITKPGISNKDLATANVNGSTDNFIVKITETDEATRAVADALTGKYGSLENILYYAMDISLYDSTGTVKITDTTGLSVDITIPIPDALVAYGGNNMAGAVVNGNQLESLNENFTTINGVPCIRFTATHFSPYTVYVDTGNLTEGMLDTTPKTGDPIHPKWFLSLGLACLSIILFIKKDKKVKVKTA